MSATTMQPPAVPPRPTRNQDKDERSSSLPKIPPRPIKNRLDRPASPNNPDRFAPSPLNESPFLSRSPKATRSSPSNGNGFLSEPTERPASVVMPSVGEEGAEYEAVSEEPASSPEHTRTIGEDIKLHAPKPSLPAQSAKQRVAAVTRTDSDRAASFGIGRPSSDEPGTAKSSVRMKASASQVSGSDGHVDEEQGIPEIGQRVPMLPFAGDIQAPSPAPISGITEGLKAGRHHGRKSSARGFVDLPPGSYGLHGHGVTPSDKLEKAYYEKRPDLLQRERSVPLHDRQNDFAMSSKELNKVVRETASRGTGLGTTAAMGTPSEELGYQAVEYVSRLSSPRPKSALSPQQQAGQSLPPPDVSVTDTDDADSTIHIDDPSTRRRSYVPHSEGEATPPEAGSEEPGYTAPILAEDEVAKDPSPYELQPAVEPPPERRGSAFEIEEPPSRPTSRPASIYREVSHDFQLAPLEDVQEYEPLFPEGSKDAKEAPAAAEKRKPRHQFPSKDVWEDAPPSAHYSAEVSTPDLPQEPQSKPELKSPEERTETPAIAFARHQEELAEKESQGADAFLSREQKAEAPKPQWMQLKAEAKQSRPSMAQRFPSRDVWEDAPESHMHETTVGGPQDEEEPKVETKPQVPARPQKKLTDPATRKPAVPERPKPKSTPSEEKLGQSPEASVAAAEKPKPQVPARPGKSLHSGAESKEADASSKPKPAVPIKPLGGKIAALQAGFMSDLNNRLKLGPQAPKKEEPAAEDLAEEKKEKAPLADARKGRARGPQRRAPAASPGPAAALESTSAKSEESTKAEAPKLAFSVTTTAWSIDPDDGAVSVGAEDEGAAREAEVVKEEKEAEQSKAESKSEPKTESEPDTESKTETTVEAKTEAEPQEAKTLASNMAGETVAEATIETGPKDEVDVEDVEEVAKD